MVAPVVLVASPFTRLQRRREPGAHAAKHGDLRVLLWAHYGWSPVGQLGAAVRRLQTIGEDQAIRPVTFKRELRTAHSDHRSRDHAVQMDEIEAFLSGPSRSWTAIASFGRSLSDRYRIEAKRHSSASYFAALGDLMMVGQTLNVLLDRSARVIFPTFCEFCWRVTLTSQKYCRVHSPFGSSPGGLLSTPSDDHWSARRLKAAFGSQIAHLRATDRRTKAVSQWLESLQAGTEVEWLADHRPMVYAATAVLLLGNHAGQVRRLVSVLDQAPGEQPSLRSSFHDQLCRPANERDVFEMTRRAEAWLIALEERRMAWGGARKGAGRKRTTQGDVRA